ncbi:hypothetical protein GXP71_01140 [Cellulomonas sp. H30R-01]|uniref:FtsX-like permease family protein n=1 Tax=Cellulomonas sp. H30R-01 TaxID=2704467 RepID=UPI00138BF623|nr:FtsX-like permease family protein [Cellulomonas sp. H30R-01]QHT54838.1 hypothetical protein GXP71_01140 [Cellulomonas sp. H30R-01]
MTTTTTRPGTPAAAPAPEQRGGALRAATALAPLVSRRRSRDDAGLLTLAAVLLAVTVLLSVALPRLQARTADATVRGVVAEAGADADVAIRLPNRDDIGAREPDPDEATLLANSASVVWGETPRTIRAVTAAPVTGVETITRTARVAGVGQVMRLVHVGSNEVGAPLVRWVEGAAPAASVWAAPAEDTGTAGPAITDKPAPEREIQVGLAARTAEELGIDVGTRFPLTLPAPGRVVAHVTGFFEPIDPTAAQWQTYDDLLAPFPAATGSKAENRVAYLLSDESLADAMAALQVTAISRLVRLPAEPEAFSERGAATVARDLSVLLATPGTYATPDGQPGIETDLPAVLDDAVDRLTAARAQASVLLVGLATVGALALVLAARLLVGRREGLLLAERARGASVASVVVRALAESVPVGLVAAATGALVAVLLVPGTEGGWLVAGLVAVVAMVAPAVASALVVRRAWTGARQPANRSDRERIARRRGARRVTAELALAAIAAAAVVSVRGRGLVPSSTGDVDLLLAAAPALLAAAATVLAARVLPPVLRGLSRAATRRRGLVGVVATARAARATGTLVPILTLTTAVALVVFSGTTAVTVRAGQLTAADVVVGATVRLDGSVSTEEVDLLRTAPGVDAVASASERIGRSFGQSSGVKARVLMVDAVDMARVLEARGEPSDGWARLADPSTAGLPALLTPDLLRTAQILEPEFMAADGFVPIDVQGTVDDVPRVMPLDDEALAELQAGGTDPAFVVDRARYQQVVGSAVPLQTVWVQGPGAAAAVRDAGLEDKAGVKVTVREEWLESARSSPVGAGLTILLLGSAAVLAMYAAVALALTVVATSRERGRTLSALRTQGLDARTARALTLGELAPLAVVAVVAGTAIGVVVPWALTDALGLDLLTGAPGTAELRLTWVPVAGAAAVIGVSLVAAVLVESAVRRRDRLGEVLRVGER